MTAVAIACVLNPVLCPPPPPHRDPSTDVGLGGLIAATGKALPLREVRVRADIVGHCARTVVEQRFGNDLAEPVEAVHIFPLPPAGAVVEMELHAGDTVVVADCREKEEAARTFQAAREAGHRAALLTQERADVHTLRVTRIPPGAEIRVRLVVLQALEAQDGLFRWRFPTVVAPRYTPGDAKGHDGPGVAPDTDRVPDASRLSPPIRLAGGTKLDLEVSIQGPVSEVQASSHAAAVRMVGGAVRVAPAGKATLDRDFVVAFGVADAETPALRAFTDGQCTLVVACAPTDRLPRALPRDAVFVVDISGSMDGEKMTAAKAALTAALHGLLPGDRFRLIAFDDRIEHFSRGEFVEYGDATLQAADRFIQQLYPRGGTEMLPAIQAALAGATPEGRLRTVLFITDGQATNEAELVAAVAGRRGAARFFTLGIDTAVNEALMARLARVGGGVCELATPADDIELTVARLESRFGLPLVDALEVRNGDPARPEPGTLFVGRPATMLVAGAPDKIAVRGRAPDGEFAAEAVPVRVDFPLTALWARERIAFLEDRLVFKPYEEEALRPEILRLGLAHHLATRYTAFVAVEKTRTVGGELLEVVVPVEKPHGWTDRFAGGPGGGGFPAGLVGAPPPPPSVMPSPAPSPSPAPFPAPGAVPGGPPPVIMARAKAARPAPAPASPAAAPAAASGRGGVLSQAVGAVKRAFWPGAGDADDDDRAASALPAEAEMEPSPLADGLLAEADESESFAAAPRAEEKAAKERAPAEKADAFLARTQKADGSWGGDVRRTAAALLALVLLGNTRRSGARSRVVLKAAAWLEPRRGEAAADAALEALAAAERGERPAEPAGGVWATLTAAGAEGARLTEALAARP